MTGTEAISNAVPAFKPPESRNAGITLGIMAAVLGFLLLGVTALSQITHMVTVLDGATPCSARWRARSTGTGPSSTIALQIATMAILFLGANTSYAGFPRLSSVLARDGLMPRQFMNRGDRLVFSNGIIGLTVAAIVVIVIFRARDAQHDPALCRGSLHELHAVPVGDGDPLVPAADRAAGVGGPLMNGVGATAHRRSSPVVIVITKFTHGAYIVVIAVPVLVALFYVVKRHYDRVARVLEPQSPFEMEEMEKLADSRPRTTAVLFVAQVNSLTARSLSLARSLSPDDVHAVTIGGDPARLESPSADLGTDLAGHAAGGGGVSLSGVRQAGAGLRAFS